MLVASVAALATRGPAMLSLFGRPECARLYRKFAHPWLLTVIVLGAFVWANFSAFHEVKEAQRKTENRLADQRAWIAPRNATLSAEPKIGVSLNVVISYDNPGREPATDFSYAVDAFTALPERVTADEGKLRIYEKMCKNKTKALPGQESGLDVFPSSGFSPPRNLTIHLRESMIDEATIAGEKLLFVQGCFAYKTINMSQRSYFCYYYRPGFTKISSLNYCK